MGHPGVRCRIGTAGWSIPRAAAERFAGEGAHLERYGRVMNCAEINSTFYRPPMASTWGKWAGQVPEGFEFAVKAPKTITHEAKLVSVEGLLTDFLAAAGSLGEKLGPILLQLPPKLAFARGVAEAFFRLLRERFAGQVVVEPRHETWFSEYVAAMLREFRVARVAADPARVPEAAVPGGFEGLAYYRLHGSPRMYYSSYSGEYLAELALRVADVDEAWVIFDNTALGAALGDALELMARLRAG